MKTESILITGSKGFLGQYVVEEASKRGFIVHPPTRKECDLLDFGEVSALFRKVKPKYVIHLATPSGGVPLLKDHPEDAFYQNLMMAINVLKASAECSAEKVVIAGSALAYPAKATLPYKEEDFWSGYPDDLEAPYGMAHKAAISYSKALLKSKGLKTTYLVLSNLYGPKDHFDNNSHVIPSMIKKFDSTIKEGKSDVEMWGTGIAKREFLYVADAASGILNVLKKDTPEILNFGSGQEISIKELAESVAKLISFNGTIKWDPSKPEGRLRRCLDSSIAHNDFGLSSPTSFKVGIKNTVHWYLKEKSSIQ